MPSECVFCRIVSGDSPSHTIWEDEKHIAFLSIFPNTEGFSVVATKEHLPSYVFENDDNIIAELMKASKKVAKLLDSKIVDVGRTGIIFEGLGVDHLHAKLFPMHGTAALKEWQKISSSVDKYFDHYEGYISSHNYQRASDEELAKLAKKIRQ